MTHQSPVQPKEDNKPMFFANGGRRVYAVISHAETGAPIVRNIPIEYKDEDFDLFCSRLSFDQSDLTTKQKMPVLFSGPLNLQERYENPLIPEIAIAAEKQREQARYVFETGLAVKSLMAIRKKMLKGEVLSDDEKALELVQISDWHFMNLSGANLSNIKVDDVDFSDTALKGAHVTGALFKRCRFHNTVAPFLQAQNSFFFDCSFDMATLTRSDFTKSEFFKTDLAMTSLWAANLYQSKLTDTFLSGVILRDADLRGVQIMDTDNYSRLDDHETHSKRTLYKGLLFSGAKFGDYTKTTTLGNAKPLPVMFQLAVAWGNLNTDIQRVSQMFKPKSQPSAKPRIK